MPALTAFVLFADIEDDFEDLEDKIIQMDMAMDAAVQHQIDVMRGK